ncbi:ribonucleotide reductase N-terminal alpha domain-containing protein [Hydrogenivirga sp.]
MEVIKRSGQRETLDINKIRIALEFAFKGLNVDPLELETDAQIQFRDGITTEEIQAVLIRTAAEKVSPETPDWQFAAARLLLYDLYKKVAHIRGYEVRDELSKEYKPYNTGGFYEFVKRFAREGIYGDYLLENYSEEDFRELGSYINPERDLYFNYTGIKILTDRYLARDEEGRVIELPQEMYMLISMTLAIPEKDKVKWAKEFYDLLSEHLVTVATPTLMNARRPFTQLSSCFILTIDDDLYDIFDNVQKAAQISKHAGGLGIYIGKLRATGAPIRKFKGASSGVIPAVKVINDVMTYVDQLGMRKGSASITLDIWHKDVLDFLEVKTNAGDERKKAHDIHPAISIPDIFMKRVKSREKWTLMDPYYTKNVRDGKNLEDLWGEAFEEEYLRLERELPEEAKKEVDAFELWKRLLTVAFETGEPYLFFRDHANRINPNKHAGMVYSSNLCVTGDTRLATQFGLVKARDLYASGEPIIATYDRRTDGDPTNMGVDTALCIKMHKTAEKADVWEIETKDGYTIKATEWHEFYVLENSEVVKKKLKELKVGDKLLIQSGRGQFGSEGSYELGFLLGWITGDGTFARDSRNGYQSAVIDLYNEDIQLRELVYRAKDSVVNSYYHQVSGRKVINDYERPIATKVVNHTEASRKLRICSTKLGRIMEELFGFRTETKHRVPEVVFRGTEETVRGYLQALFTADATVEVIRNDGVPTFSIQLTSKSRELLKDVQILLANFGIKSSIYRRSGGRLKYVTTTGEEREYFSGEAYRLDIKGTNAVRFVKEIGFIGFKQKKALRVLEERKALGYKEEGRKKEKFLSEVVNIRYVGKEDVYDTTQLYNHSLIFNGIVTGNCHEIVQNMSVTKHLGRELDHETGEITYKKQSGDVVVCNLGSINLGKVHTKETMEHVVPRLVRLLDNVIEMNYYAIPEAEYTNKRYRAIGIGVSNYHYCLVKNGVQWESEEHLRFADRLFELIAFYAVKGSMELAKERGKYRLFEGSDWSRGILFGRKAEDLEENSRENGNDLPWGELAQDVREKGMRNAYLIALMPTGSTSLILGATPSVDPIFAKYYKEENMSGILPQVPPEIDRFFWHYKSAYNIDQEWVIRAAAVRQKWIDQAQSLNLFIDPEKIDGPTLSKIYQLAWELGLKTIYYLRSKSVTDIEECESCAV